MNEMYSKYAGDYAKAIEANIYNAHYDRPSLLSLIDGERFENCLDMGCGPGAYIDALDKQCDNIVAIDRSNEFIKIIKERYPSIKSYLHDLNNPLFEENSSYDLVISPLTIHYIKDLQSLFAEVSRILQPNGTFIFSTHHPVMDYKESVSGNYFECEMLTQMWKTIGDKKTEVSFYRRPLSEIMKSLFDAGFIVSDLFEGKVDEKVRNMSVNSYKRLSTHPQFIFIKAIKK